MMPKAPSLLLIEFYVNRCFPDLSIKTVTYPGSKAVRYSAILYALYIGVGVSVSIHSFPDCAAGAITGTVIGVVMGASFRSAAREAG